MGVSGRPFYSSKRWERARFLAKRRDGFKCVECGSRNKLEVHHIKPVRDRPDLAFDLVNLRTLCRDCHAIETNKELGRVHNAERNEWKVCVRDLSNTSHEGTR